MGNTARLFPVPNSFLKFFSRMIGRQNEVNRLLSSLQVDISHTKEILNWKPIKSVEEGIKYGKRFMIRLFDVYSH